MPISYVGGQIVGDNTGTASGTINFSLTGGSNSTPSAGDLVLYYVCLPISNDQTFPNPYNGYTKYLDIFADDANDTNHAVYYKFMGSTPDTTWPRYPSGNTFISTVYGVSVWRGVDTANPFDVSAVTATVINTGVPPTTNITPATSGAVPVFSAAYALSSTSPPALTNASLSGYLSANPNISGTDGVLAFGYRSWTSGAINAGTWSGANTNANNSATATALALRPASGGQIKVWNGSSWTAKPVKVWNGSSWVKKPVKRWNGSSWITLPY